MGATAAQDLARFNRRIVAHYVDGSSREFVAENDAYGWQEAGEYGEIQSWHATPAPISATDTVLADSGLPTDLVASMAIASHYSRVRCYRHPESPTGYIGRGQWCEHKRARMAAR